MVLAREHVTLDCAFGKVIAGKLTGYADQYTQQDDRRGKRGDIASWSRQGGLQ